MNKTPEEELLDKLGRETRDDRLSAETHADIKRFDKVNRGVWTAVLISLAILVGVSIWAVVT